MHSGRRRPNKIIVLACLPPRANNRLLPQCNGTAGGVTGDAIGCDEGVLGTVTGL